MNNLKYFVLSALFVTVGVFAQQDQEKNEPQQDHKNENKLKQLYEEFSTPNMYCAAYGAPGSAY